MRTALFFKVLAGYVLVVIVFLVIFPVISYRVAYDHQKKMLTERLENVARAVAVTMAAEVAAGPEESIRSEIRYLAETTDTRLTFLDREGNVVADSHAQAAAVSDMRAYPEIRGALLGRTTAALRQSPTLDIDMLYVAVPVRLNDELAGVARSSTSLSRLNALVRDLRLRLWYAAGLVAAVALAIALITSLSFSRSIEHVGHLMDEIRKGNFSVRLFLRRSDTLARVAEKVNAMAERLDQVFGDLTIEKDKLDSIVASLQDGLLLLDHDGVIQFANESFCRVFGCTDLIGKHYWETVREPAFTDLVGIVVHHGQSCRREVTIRDRTYLCAAAPVRTRQQVVILFHDITEVRQLAQMKRDFVANVSHELRTPLTAIKGFTDMVTETATAEQQRHLQVIRRHTDRLIYIV